MSYTIKTGDILVSRWGYDQTNVDFYFVLKRTAKMVEVVRIESDRRDGEGFMTYTATPRMPIRPSGKPIRRKVQEYRGDEYVAVKDYANAREYDGEPVRGSSYA